MTLAIDSAGWLTQTTQKKSLNYNERPPHCAISLLVIHNISVPAGDFASEAIFDLFQNNLDCCLPHYRHLAGLRVSAHSVIRRTGAIVQCVAFDKRAWHAGVSVFDGVTDCNDYSIGIELEGTDTLAYTDAQYVSLIALTRLLQEHYPLITLDRITGHEHIAPGRKTDPGIAFDWRRYKSALVGK